MSDKLEEYCNVEVASQKSMKKRIENSPGNPGLHKPKEEYTCNIERSFRI
jgi:hypothetical protein